MEFLEFIYYFFLVVILTILSAFTIKILIQLFFNLINKKSVRMVNK